MSLHTKSQEELVERNYKTTVGFWIYLMTDSILFASLFAMYVVLRPGVAAGPSSAEIFQMPMVLAETIILLVSSLTCGLALLAFRYKHPRQAMGFLLATFIAGLGFLAIELTEFGTLISEGHSWTQSAFLSGFFTLVATHGIHIAVGLLWLVVLVIMYKKRGMTPKIARQFGLFGLFWHFLDLIWIFIFTVVYLGGVI